MQLESWKGFMLQSHVLELMDVPVVGLAFSAAFRPSKCILVTAGMLSKSLRSGTTLGS